MYAFLVCVLTFLLALPGVSSYAQTEDPVSTAFSLYRPPPSQDSPLILVLWVDPKPGWHAYSHTPGESGQPLQAAFHLASGGPPLPVYYPEGERKPDAFEPDKMAVVYERKTPIFVAAPDPADKDVAITGELSVFLCSSASCWPVRRTLEYRLDPKTAANAPLAESEPWWPEYLAARKLTLAQDAAKAAGGSDTGGARPAAGPAQGLAQNQPPNPLQNQIEAAVSLPQAAPPQSLDALAATLAAETKPLDWSAVLSPRFASPALEVGGMAKAALLALLAGFILNFMPCVLPVISLKLGSLLSVCANGDIRMRRAALRKHNAFFALGILTYFAALSLILGFAGMAWGELFQKPGLVLAVTAVLFALSMSLFGVFHLPVIDLRLAKGATDECEPAKGAFLTGTLATLLATPCSGPFLGGVLAWALLQPIAVIVAIFFCIGLGMAAPYLLLAIFPSLTRFMPRPGPWMRKLETFMGFVLAATCVYFLAILPQHLIIPALGALVATAFAAWIWGSWTSLSQSRINRWSIRLFAVALAAGAVALAASLPPPDDAAWVLYDQKAFQELLGKENILADFTADWCPTCKFLEKTVLTEQNLEAWNEEYGLTLVKVDLTRNDPKTMGLLRALGSQSIPLVALFPKGEGKHSPVVLRDLFTKAQLEEALRLAFE